MRCFVVAGFLLTSASRGPSAIAELLVDTIPDVTDTHTYTDRQTDRQRQTQTQTHTHTDTCTTTAYTVLSIASRGKNYASILNCAIFELQ